MYGFAKTISQDGAENFTTEVLAAAIRDDSKPLVRALSTAGLALGSSTAIHSVSTQVAVESGFVDLSIELSQDGSRREFWFEVKLNAPESGDQLSRYLAAARLRSNGPSLVTIGPRALSTDVPWLPWQTIWNASAPTHTLSTWWSELRAFLEERGMADDSFEPISAAEAAALGPAHALFRKARRVVYTAVSALAPRWPDLPWPTDERQVAELMTFQLRHNRRCTIEVTRARWPGRLHMGISDEFGRPAAYVWVEHEPKLSAFRHQLVERADVGRLPHEIWERRLEWWQTLVAENPIGQLHEQAELASWLVDRVDELGQAGILRMLRGS